LSLDVVFRVQQYHGHVLKARLKALDDGPDGCGDVLPGGRGPGLRRRDVGQPVDDDATRHLVERLGHADDRAPGVEQVFQVPEDGPVHLLDRVAGHDRRAGRLRVDEAVEQGRGQAGLELWRGHVLPKRPGAWTNADRDGTVTRRVFK